MRKVASGDLPAFRALYDRYKGPVMSYVFQIVRNEASAEEIAQEVFLRVYRSREGYSPDAKFTTWLWTIARNLAFDHTRKKGEVPMGENLPEAESDEAMPEAEQRLVEKATRAAVEGCLDELPLAQKEAVSLRIFSELSYDEIAAAMKVTLAATKSMIHRAKASLTDCLRQGGHHE